MPKIQTLAPHVADLIAAGEVVERPAGAVKELVENSVDAGAKHITVELKNGGMTFLRVTDDGCGMSAEDAPAAFLRHATSKLRTAEDLEAIGTLGFRGEALAAIAAVSRVDLLTRTEDAPLGVSLRLDAGTIAERSEAGCPVGTTIIVRDLFHNTPARMKYMKNDSTEAAAILSAVQHQALAHPEVAVRVLRDGVEQLSTPGNGKLYGAIYAVWGRVNAQGLVPVGGNWGKMHIEGFVSRPSATRGNRSNQLFFVNGRFIRSKTMCAALEEAYRNQLLPGRFPSCVLHLTMPENAVDVNVHPAKTEVKFLHEREVFDCIHYGVLTALGGADAKVQMQLPKDAEKPRAQLRDVAAPEKREAFRTMTAQEYRAFAEAFGKMPAAVPSEAVRASLARQQMQTRYEAGAEVAAAMREGVPVSAEIETAPPELPDRAEPLQPRENVTPEKPGLSLQTPVTSEPETKPSCEEAQLTFAPREAEPFRLIGEVFSTYILVEQGKELLLIDKHAAHERLLFESFRAQKGAQMSQFLLQPILCEPERAEAALLLENAAQLEESGFEISDYGDGTIAVRRIPAQLPPEQTGPALDALAEQLSAGRKLSPDDLRDVLLHTIACKAAVKGGDKSDRSELEALAREVLSREDLKYCPHGRPICVSLTERQLERQFRRA